MQNQMDCPLNIHKIGNKRKNFCTLNRVIWKEAAGQCVNLIFPTMRCNRIKISFFYPPSQESQTCIWNNTNAYHSGITTHLVSHASLSTVLFFQMIETLHWRGLNWNNSISSAFLLFHSNPLVWRRARSWPHDHLKRHSHRYWFKIWHSIR